ncbi:MAG: CAP domain-containing protein [Gammaproteobacteria bacterium]|nr:CAP domain-containing protein [Gammaproteobacteria bacterium]
MSCKLLAVVLCLPVVAAAGADGAEEFERVNRIRQQAGLAPLQAAQRLDHAARDHAAYLDRHREPGVSAHGLTAHNQVPGEEGFSGTTPADRALAAGYPHRQVLENVSMGYDSAASALDGLMSAIYHRLTFLDLTADQLGVAVGEQSRVFMLGRSDIESLCAAPPPAALMQTPVDCLGQPMQRQHYLSLCADLPIAAHFQPPHPVACPDGTRLDAGFMQDICARPPPVAKFSGYGRYFDACDNGQRIDADWFGRICAGQLPQALYRASGSYYSLCDPPEKIAAEWLEAHCAALPESARYTESLRYRLPCTEPHEIRVEYLDRLDLQQRGGSPEIVIWPPDGAQDVPPAFFVEEPDPLPDLDVSGYPLSLQVNPGRVGKVTLHRFALYRLHGEQAKPVEHLRLLDHSSDPHAVLDAHTFVLFPLQRLEWGAQYQAVAELTLDGKPREISWSFTTRGTQMRLLTAAAVSQRFVIDNDVDYLLYLPPAPEQALTAMKTRAEHHRTTRLELQPVDANTVRVRIDAPACDRIRLRFDSGREVSLIPSVCPGWLRDAAAIMGKNNGSSG